MKTLNELQQEENKLSPSEMRLSIGEAWMWCNDCGAKLYSFDGGKDTGIKCPYKAKNGGRCE